MAHYRVTLRTPTTVVSQWASKVEKWIGWTVKLRFQDRKEARQSRVRWSGFSFLCAPSQQSFSCTWEWRNNRERKQKQGARSQAARGCESTKKSVSVCVCVCVREREDNMPLARSVWKPKLKAGKCVWVYGNVLPFFLSLTLFLRVCVCVCVCVDRAGRPFPKGNICTFQTSCVREMEAERELCSAKAISRWNRTAFRHCTPTSWSFTH